MTTTASRRATGTLLFLVISIVLEASILGTDMNLRNDGIMHFYALAGFTVVDIVLLAMAFMNSRRMTLRLVALWGVLQAVVMIADIFNGPSTYGTYSQFATYLFGLGYYDSNHIAFLFPALFVVRILLAAAAFRDSGKA
ncbi:MAG TPA: hypothetical protein VEB67_00325 [Nitrososphaerales archaeon]|nr:hypothetical protein [Nitrososphaerales archaeon]